MTVPATRLAPIGRGLRLRCPACGRGRLSPSWYAIARFADACAVCRLRFEKQPGEFLGAMMFGQGIIGATGLGLYFLLFSFTRVPIWLQAAWIATFGVLLPLLAYRHIKGAWVGLLYALDPWPVGSAREGLRPPPW